MTDRGIDLMESLERERDDLRRELRGVQEMLFLVLDTVGEPVQVPAEVVSNGIEGDKMIDITLDTDNLFWTFRIVEVPTDVE